MSKREPTPTQPIELPDGSLEWPTDPDYEPTGHPEQDLTPVPDTTSTDPDYELPDSGADPGWEDQAPVEED
jgi:hypothetical protein